MHFLKKLWRDFQNFCEFLDNPIGLITVLLGAFLVLIIFYNVVPSSKSADVVHLINSLGENNELCFASGDTTYTALSYRYDLHIRIATSECTVELHDCDPQMIAPAYHWFMNVDLYVCDTQTVHMINIPNAERKKVEELYDHALDGFLDRFSGDLILLVLKDKEAKSAQTERERRMLSDCL